MKEDVKFEDWDWKKNDAEFYEVFHRNPLSKDEKSRRQVKWNRY
jgi:hypothetical protein